MSAATTIASYPVHPAAELFPMADSPEEFIGFSQDSKTAVFITPSTQSGFYFVAVIRDGIADGFIKPVSWEGVLLFLNGENASELIWGRQPTKPVEKNCWLEKPIKQEKQSFIYFIECADSGAIKIGISDCPEKRLLDLQNSCPLELQLVAKFHGSHADERALHERFKDLRIRGEWFLAAPTLIAYIDQRRNENES